MDTGKPTLYLTTNDLPDIKNWKVGQSYEVIVKIKQTSVHQSEGMPMGASFEVQEVEYPDAEEMDMGDVADMPNHSDFMKGAAKLRQKSVEGY